MKPAATPSHAARTAGPQGEPAQADAGPAGAKSAPASFEALIAKPPSPAKQTQRLPITAAESWAAQSLASADGAPDQAPLAVLNLVPACPGSTASDEPVHAPAARKTAPRSAEEALVAASPPAPVPSIAITATVAPAIAHAPVGTQPDTPQPGPGAVPFPALRHAALLPHATPVNLREYPVAVTQVSFERHLAPASPPPAIGQIAGAAVSLARASDAAPASAAGAGDAASPMSPPIAAPLGVLNLTLSPAELGDVTVSLHLRGAHIELRVAAQYPATARLVEENSEALRAALGRAGYEVGDIRVRVAAEARGTEAQTEPGTGQGNSANGQDAGASGQKGQQNEAFRRGGRSQRGAFA